MGLRDVAGLGEQHGHRVLRGRHDVRLRGVDHHHPALRGRGDVDVVEPDARPADHHQARRVSQHVRRHLGGGADDQGVDIGQLDHERIGVEVEPHVHLMAGAPEQVQSTVGDLFRHEDAGHRAIVVGGPALDQCTTRERSVHRRPRVSPGTPAHPADTTAHGRVPSCHRPPHRVGKTRPRDGARTGRATAAVPFGRRGDLDRGPGRRPPGTAGPARGDDPSATARRRPPRCCCRARRRGGRRSPASRCPRTTAA